jgi:hypothetical protein
MQLALSMASKFNLVMWLAFVFIAIACTSKKEASVWSPKQERNYRQIADSLLLNEISRYKQEELTNDSASLVAVYVFTNSKYIITSVNTLSSIYYNPFSYFTITEEKPILFYDNKIGFVDPWTLDKKLVSYVSNFLINNINDSVYNYRQIKELKGADTVMVEQKLPEVILPVSHDPVVWEIHLDQDSVVRKKGYNYEPLYNYHFVRVP